ncbi:hypothetical protein Hanom_Chr00s000004g01609331 [Helianthus anomalus]
MYSICSLKMPESRVRRISRPNDDIAEMYNSRRQMAVGSIGILPDIDDSERSVSRTPFRSAIRGGGFGRGLFGTPITVSQNTLPAWYPHTPLRDITHVVRGLIESFFLRFSAHLQKKTLLSLC